MTEHTYSIQIAINSMLLLTDAYRKADEQAREQYEENNDDYRSIEYVRSIVTLLHVEVFPAKDEITAYFTVRIL